MIDRPAGSRQLDLLVRAANTLDPSRVTRQIRTEVASLLRLLLAEHIAGNLMVPLEAADD
jgi:hypothetical protein